MVYSDYYIPPEVHPLSLSRRKFNEITCQIRNEAGDDARRRRFDEKDAGLRAVHVPGHCAGQLAFLWAQHGGVLIAADACSNMMGLGLSLGYEDLEMGRRSLRKLSALRFNVPCFGHGKPIMQNASAEFRKRWP